MKLYNLIPAAIAAAALAAASCTPDLDFSIPGDKIGFNKTEVFNEVSVFDGTCDLAVVKSGKGTSAATVKVEICSAAEVDAYNASKVDTSHNFVAIDPSYYQVSETSFEFAATDTRKVVTFTWNADRMATEYAGLDAVIPVRICESSIDTDSTRTLVFIHPFVSKLGVHKNSYCKNLYPSKDVVTPADTVRYTATLELDRALSKTDVEVELAVDNNLIALVNTEDRTYTEAPAGLVSLLNTKVTIPAGELFGTFDVKVNYSKLFDSAGEYCYNDIYFATPITIKSKTPAGLDAGEYVQAFVLVNIADSRTVIRPSTEPDDIVGDGTWTLLEGAENDMAHDPNKESSWYDMYNANKLVDGNFQWYLGAMCNWFWTENIFPIEYVFDLQKSYIFDAFRLVDAKSHQNQYRHIQVYTAEEYADADTDWVLACEGTRTFESGWQQWPDGNDTKEGLDEKFTYHMPEDSDPAQTNSFELTQGRYIKLVLVEPHWTTGDYINGRGYLMEFYFRGWEN